MHSVFYTIPEQGQNSPFVDGIQLCKTCGKDVISADLRYMDPLTGIGRDVMMGTGQALVFAFHRRPPARPVVFFVLHTLKNRYNTIFPIDSASEVWDNLSKEVGKNGSKWGDRLIRTPVLIAQWGMERMFFGSHQHTIDDKGRLTLPAKWRSELAGGVVVTRGLDDCLFIFPRSKFHTIAEEIDQQGIELSDARAWARYFLGMASDAESDKQGRILLPQNLRDFAGLDGEVVVVGVVSRVEVWNPERYKQANAKIESDVNAVAERMGQVMKRAAGKADH